MGQMHKVTVASNSKWYTRDSVCAGSSLVSANNRIVREVNFFLMLAFQVVLNLIILTITTCTSLQVK